MHKQLYVYTCTCTCTVVECKKVHVGSTALLSRCPFFLCCFRAACRAACALPAWPLNFFADLMNSVGFSVKFETSLVQGNYSGRHQVRHFSTETRWKSFKAFGENRFANGDIIGSLQWCSLETTTNTYHLLREPVSTVRIERLCVCLRLTIVGPRAVRDGHTGHCQSLLEIVCLFMVTSREKEEVAPFQLFSRHG